MIKKGKTLRNLLCAGTFLATSIFPGCEKEDTTPPKVTFESPLEGNVYYDRVVPIQLKIEDENGDFKSGWLSVNGEEKFPIYSKSFAINWYCKRGDNKIVVRVEDLKSNASKDSTSFYVWDGWVKGNDSNSLNTPR